MMWLEEHDTAGTLIGLALGLAAWAGAGITIWTIRGKGKR